MDGVGWRRRRTREEDIGSVVVVVVGFGRRIRQEREVDDVGFGTEGSEEGSDEFGGVYRQRRE